MVFISLEEKTKTCLWELRSMAGMSKSKKDVVIGPHERKERERELVFAFVKGTR